jgi:hypothetical protein
MAWNIAVKALMDSKQSQQVGRNLLCGGTSLALPEKCIEIVSLAKDGAFPDVKGLC